MCLLWKASSGLTWAKLAALSQSGHESGYQITSTSQGRFKGLTLPGVSSFGQMKWDRLRPGPLTYTGEDSCGLGIWEHG